MNGPKAFPMLEVLQLPPKPRKDCMILMSEVGIPLRQAEDILETASQTMLSLETEQTSGRPAPDLVNALFRAIHSFKGLAGMFGLGAGWANVP